MTTKSKLVKLRAQSAKMAQEMRRSAARQADVQRLQKMVWLSKHRVIAFFAAWFGFRVFDWAQRYDNKYLIRVARANKWAISRVVTAVETLDYAKRVQTNRKVRVLDAIRRRAVNVMKFNRRKQAAG